MMNNLMPTGAANGPGGSAFCENKFRAALEAGIAELSIRTIQLKGEEMDELFCDGEVILVRPIATYIKDYELVLSEGCVPFARFMAPPWTNFHCKAERIGRPTFLDPTAMVEFSIDQPFYDPSTPIPLFKIRGSKRMAWQENLWVAELEGNLVWAAKVKLCNP
jgi:hypothetical protein